jgi:hypothetical protein
MKKLALLLLLAFVSAACLTNNVKREKVEVTPTAIPIIISTATPVQPPTAAVQGTQAAFTNITFSIPAGLAVTAHESTSTDVEYPVINPSGGPMAEHTVITFQPYPLVNKARISVFKSAEYAAYDESLKNAVLSLAANEDAFQPLPKSLAGSFYVSAQPLTFKNGHGVRYLTQAMTGYGPVNNDDLFYFFQGLSRDGRYFISAVFPVNAPYLAPDGRTASALPEGGIPFPANPGAPGEYSNYLDAVTRKLNGTDAAGFTPSLAQIDTLIMSIEVQ